MSVFLCARPAAASVKWRLVSLMHIVYQGQLNCCAHALCAVQAAAAAARQAAQAAARQQLKQQAEAAAVSYMAAWRIARAWQNYRRSPAHAEKLAAVVALQAAVRGAAARQLLQQKRRRHGLLNALHAAESSGQLDALQQAAAEASLAGGLAGSGRRHTQQPIAHRQLAQGQIKACR
jgi:hypothetical protein